RAYFRQTESSVTNSTGRIDTTSKRARFRQLHATGCFVLPNPWDAGSARRLEKLGFAALASSSAGMAWALGRDDYGVPRDLVLDHLRMLCAATDLPVNADFEDGFAEDAAGVAANAASRSTPVSPVYRSRIARAAACAT